MPNRLLAFVGIAIVAAIALTGCVPNQVATASQVTVKLSDDRCTVSRSSAPSGNVAFTLTNSGTDVKEFEILAEDKLRVVGEKENVTPGQTVSLVAQLEPGIYYTGCKFQQVGTTTGQSKFTVTGASIAVDRSTQQLTTAAVTNYVSYVRSQVRELIPAVSKLTTAYETGDDATARSLFAGARVWYERIEPTSEQFGDLDPKIDDREVDAVAENLSWTGFHRIEKDLWPPSADSLNSDGTSGTLNWAPSTPADRKVFGDGLVADVQQLGDLVDKPGFTVSLSDISNGATGLLDEVAKSKITGEEDWWSHTDLDDFQANVQGAEVAFGNVRLIAESKGTSGTKLVASIQREFAALNALLAKYGSIQSGFTSYEQVTDAQRRALSDQVNALAEPLSQLTHTVLGVPSR